jgi:hypothetical protein
MGRGTLTKEVQEIAKKHIGREIDRTELHLIPYAQYVMVNEQRLDPNKITGDERKILRKWKDAGLVEGGAGGFSITEDFWDFACDILWQAYVKREGEPIE